MQAWTRRRTGYAIAGSALAHFVVLGVAFVQRPTLPIPPYVEAPSPDAIQVELVRRPAPSAKPQPLSLHRAPQQPLPGAPAPLSAVQPPGPPAPLAAAPSLAPAAPAPGSDLRAGLRRGPAGCVNLASTRSASRAESDDCNDRLGRGGASGPVLPLQIQPRLRAYYDQVALAKAPDPPPVRNAEKPPTGSGPAGIFWLPDIPTNGHGPSFGCSIAFGAGKKTNTMPHALRLGPCYIEPPKGPLDPEVDLTPP
jgi:hypothetical protein